MSVRDFPRSLASWKDEKRIAAQCLMQSDIIVRYFYRGKINKDYVEKLKAAVFINVLH
jgi:hypothetical protein